MWGQGGLQGSGGGLEKTCPRTKSGDVAVKLEAILAGHRGKGKRDWKLGQPGGRSRPVLAGLMQDAGLLTAGRAAERFQQKLDGLISSFIFNLNMCLYWFQGGRGREREKLSGAGSISRETERHFSDLILANSLDPTV